MNQLSVEVARTAEGFELVFQMDIQVRHIGKIKSKTYRWIKRQEKERLGEKINDGKKELRKRMKGMKREDGSDDQDDDDNDGLDVEGGLKNQGALRKLSKPERVEGDEDRKGRGNFEIKVQEGSTGEWILGTQLSKWSLYSKNRRARHIWTYWNGLFSCRLRV